MAYILLWVTAMIWGGGYVAQSMATHMLEANSFNAARFTLATLSLIPLLYFFPHKQTYSLRFLLMAGMLAGSFIFISFTFQQTGLLYITAGDAGFISSTYIMMVPIIGLLLGYKTTKKLWIGILFALVGLYFLSIGPNLSFHKGDELELAGAFFWACHVILIGYLARRLPAIPLAITQFAFAALLSIIATHMFESPSLTDFTHEWLPILYAGILASGIACTLQILGQKNVSATVSALILSTEAIFAVIADWLFLDVSLSFNAYVGSGLILVGMLISQWPNKGKLFKGLKTCTRDKTL